MNVKLNIKPDVPNANGNIYTKDILDKAFKKYKEDYIDNGRAFGVCDKPNEYSSMQFEKVAFKIKSISEDKNGYSAEIDILNTPYGRKLKEVIDEDYLLYLNGVGYFEDNIVHSFTISQCYILPK